MFDKEHSLLTSFVAISHYVRDANILYRSTDLVHKPNSWDPASIYKQTTKILISEQFIDLVVNLFLLIQISIHG